MTIDRKLSRLESIGARTDKRLLRRTVQAAATDERLDELAQRVKFYVKFSRECRVEIRRLRRGHATQIKRLDRMVTRFDQWLRGQGPTNGRGRKEK